MNTRNFREGIPDKDFFHEKNEMQYFRKFILKTNTYVCNIFWPECARLCLFQTQSLVVCPATEAEADNQLNDCSFRAFAGNPFTCVAISTCAIHEDPIWGFFARGRGNPTGAQQMGALPETRQLGQKGQFLLFPRRCEVRRH